MNTILAIIFVLTSDGMPIHEAWVNVEGAVQTGYYQEQVTDGRGALIVEIEVGEHQMTAGKDGYISWSGIKTIDASHDVTIVLDKAN